MPLDTNAWVYVCQSVGVHGLYVALGQLVLVSAVHHMQSA
jgi:hypothetical protein